VSLARGHSVWSFFLVERARSGPHSPDAEPDLSSGNATWPDEADGARLAHNPPVAGSRPAGPTQTHSSAPWQVNGADRHEVLVGGEGLQRGPTEVARPHRGGASAPSGRPSAGAAFGGSPSLPWWPRRVVPLEQPVEVNSQSETFMVMLTA
jgi:hypothetical protein